MAVRVKDVKLLYIMLVKHALIMVKRVVHYLTFGRTLVPQGGEKWMARTFAK